MINRLQSLNEIGACLYGYLFYIFTDLQGSQTSNFFLVIAEPNILVYV